MLLALPPRRFPPPWRVDKIPAATSSVANGQSLAYLYSRQDPTEAHQAKTLTADEGRRIAMNIARLPELPGRAGSSKGEAADRSQRPHAAFHLKGINATLKSLIEIERSQERQRGDRTQRGQPIRRERDPFGDDFYRETPLVRHCGPPLSRYPYLLVSCPFSDTSRTGSAPWYFATATFVFQGLSGSAVVLSIQGYQRPIGDGGWPTNLIGQQSIGMTCTPV
jgi:hypothetical protein